jgi:hypothetical protein
MKILWVSPYPIYKSQRKTLQKMYGNDVEVLKYPTEIERPEQAEEVARKFREGNYDDIVVIAPSSVISRLLELGVKPLWAQEEVVENLERADRVDEASSTGYRFLRFKRVLEEIFKYGYLGKKAER